MKDSFLKDLGLVFLAAFWAIFKPKEKAILDTKIRHRDPGNLRSQRIIKKMRGY